MTELETRQQKIIVAVFLLLGKAYTLLPLNKRAKVQCFESEILKAWNEKKSPVRVVAENVPMQFNNIPEFEQWGGERRYSVLMGELNLGSVAKGFASVPMPKADPTHEKEEKSRVFTLE